MNHDLTRCGHGQPPIRCSCLCDIPNCPCSWPAKIQNSPQLLNGCAEHVTKGFSRAARAHPLFIETYLLASVDAVPDSISQLPGKLNNDRLKFHCLIIITILIIITVLSDTPILSVAVFIFLIFLINFGLLSRVINRSFNKCLKTRTSDTSLASIFLVCVPAALAGSVA